MKLRSFLLCALLLGMVITILGASRTHANSAARQIAINGMRLPPEQIRDVDRLLGYALPNGRYWHDVRTGAWGRMGGPPLGSMPGGYIQTTRVAISARGNGAAAQMNAPLSIHTMIDLNMDGNEADNLVYASH